MSNRALPVRNPGRGELTFEFARKHVNHYNETDEKLVQESREAMDCYDCEAFLQLGIDAFKWLLRADYVIREAVYCELYDYEPAVEKAFRALCDCWLKPCNHALGWVELQRRRGYEVSNLGEFQECCDEMRAIVDFLSGRETEMPVSLAVITEKAVKEHEDGKTAEFF